MRGGTRKEKPRPRPSARASFKPHCVICLRADFGIGGRDAAPRTTTVRQHVAIFLQFTPLVLYPRACAPPSPCPTAWGLAGVCDALHTASFFVTAVGSYIPAGLLPVIIFWLCTVVAFSVGSSWSTMCPSARARPIPAPPRDVLPHTWLYSRRCCALDACAVPSVTSFPSSSCLCITPPSPCTSVRTPTVHSSSSPAPSSCSSEQSEHTVPDSWKLLWRPRMPGRSLRPFSSFALAVLSNGWSCPCPWMSVWTKAVGASPERAHRTPTTQELLCRPQEAHPPHAWLCCCPALLRVLRLSVIGFNFSRLCLPFPRFLALRHPAASTLSPASLLRPALSHHQRSSTHWCCRWLRRLPATASARAVPCRRSSRPPSQPSWEAPSSVRAPAPDGTAAPLMYPPDKSLARMHTTRRTHEAHLRVGHAMRASVACSVTLGCSFTDVPRCSRASPRPAPPTTHYPLPPAPPLATPRRSHLANLRLVCHPHHSARIHHTPSLAPSPLTRESCSALPSSLMNCLPSHAPLPPPPPPSPHLLCHARRLPARLPPPPYLLCRTLLSSMSTSCYFTDHVATQLPYALTVGALAVCQLPPSPSPALPSTPYLPCVRLRARSCRCSPCRRPSDLLPVVRPTWPGLRQRRV